MAFEIRIAVGRAGKTQHRNPGAEREAFAFSRPVGEGTQYVSGGLALTVPVEEIDNLGVGQSTLLSLIHAGLSETKRLDGARVGRIAFGQPTEEPCCLGVSLIQVRDDIEVGLDHKAAMFD